MDLIDKLKNLSDNVSRLKDHVETEEATKTSFVWPFFEALGYDFQNPIEVKPEYVADLGIKKGEKVDYCILFKGVPGIIIECKHWKESLDPHNSQLFRYFQVTPVKLGILTNGITYRFYTDLVAPNLMDEEPFLEFSMDMISEQIVNEIKRFTKANFDSDEIYSSAGNLKFSREIKRILNEQFQNPSEDFTKFFASQIYKGRVTSKILSQFQALVKKSVKSLISEMISERLQTALKHEEEENLKSDFGQAQDQVESDGNSESIRIEEKTTEEELEGYMITKAILRSFINPDLIHIRDVKSYCSVLYDNNNRKPLIRLFFNKEQKYISLFDKSEEEKLPIESLNDLYIYADRIIAAAKKYIE